MASFCSRCSRKNKSQGLNGGKVLFLKSSAKQRGGSRCKCQWTRWLWGWSLNSGALPRPFASILFLPVCFILQFHFILPSPCRPSSFTVCWLPLKFVECNVDILRFFFVFYFFIFAQLKPSTSWSQLSWILIVKNFQCLCTNLLCESKKKQQHTKNVRGKMRNWTISLSLHTFLLTAHLGRSTPTSVSFKAPIESFTAIPGRRCVLLMYLQ